MAKGWRSLKRQARRKVVTQLDGPYRVIDSFENGAYKLEELSGKLIPRTWNTTHLKASYS